MTYVVLDRVEDVPRPDYCTHGRATCYVCLRWCWLGSETQPRVMSGALTPICLPCARLYADPSTYAVNIGDHRRADGPHA